MSINPETGLIAGIPTISGTYSVTVTGSNTSSSRTISFRIVVAPPAAPPFTRGELLAKFDLSVARLAADPVRSRVYATVPALNSVAVIDTISRSVIRTIAIGSNPKGLAVSADGSKLWVANSGSTTSAIGVLNLNTLQTLPSLPAPSSPSDIEEGFDHRLYLTGESGGIMQVDALTGAFQGTFAFAVYYDAFLEISPDRKTLYFAHRFGTESRAMRFDVSTPTPVLLQEIVFSGEGQDLALSHDGRSLVFPNHAGNGTPAYTTFLIPSSNLKAVSGVFEVGALPEQAVFSNDDSVLFHSVRSESKVVIFDTKKFAAAGTIFMGFETGGYNALDIAVDRKGGSLFVAIEYGDLRIYGTGRVDANTTPVPPPAPKSLLNVSTRLRTQGGNDVLIGGFIITGSGPKRVALRAIGPSLPVSGRATDPVLSLYGPAGKLIEQNDNWNSHRTEVLDSELAPSDERESVIIATLNPGNYTAIVSPGGGFPGVALVELYDLSASNTSRVANLSTRGKVETGDNVMIGGFIVGGGQPTKVIVRGIGLSLAVQGVPGALADPTLALHDGNGAKFAENDDWQTDQPQEITDTTIPPTDARESAIVRTLSPGNYTAIVRGKDNTDGVALVEVYNLEPR